MNWGNKLLLTFIVFASGMGYLVYRSMHVRFELTEKDYYKTELRYQQVIDGANRVNELSSALKLEQRNDVIVLELPSEMKNQSVSGDIWFYCAYDERKDKKIALELNMEGQQQFSSVLISPGRYTVKIAWSSAGKNYFSEKLLTVL